MRALALLLAVTSCTSTTKITIRGDEIYRHLPALRKTGRADVSAQTYVDDKRKGEATLETIELDTRLILQNRPRTLQDFAAGCNGKAADENKENEENEDNDESDEFLTEECYLKTYRADQFVLHEDVKSTLAVVGMASYGIMAQNISLIGVGIGSALVLAFAIGEATR